MLTVGYQFRTELSFEKGKQIIEIDSPSYLGGNGNRLGPMGYCVAGIASCFIATFATVVVHQGIRLTKLNASVEITLSTLQYISTWLMNPLLRASRLR